MNFEPLGKLSNELERIWWMCSGLLVIICATSILGQLRNVIRNTSFAMYSHYLHPGSWC
jgi:hypothetical protein